jgi:protein TonB
MVPKRRVAPLAETARTAPAVVLQFPVGASPAAHSRESGNPEPGPHFRGDERNEVATELASTPNAAERPTHFTPKVRGWLRVAFIVSIAVHVVVYLAFQLRFHDDLERATGAAASLASQGTITIPVDVVVEAMLPSAPTPTNATSSDVKPEAVDDLMPTPPDPSPVIMPKELTRIELPPPPEPAPLALANAEPAAKLALPEERTAPPRAVETAATPRAPAEAKTEQTPVQEMREQKKTARATPGAAASPSRAAGSNSAGNSGFGGAADAGGSAAISSYQAQVLAHLTRHRVYPLEARERGITGIARIQFALGRDGRVLSASLISGSGERLLDTAALDLVRRASPFPPFPAGVMQARMDFAAPIRFDLR